MPTKRPRLTITETPVVARRLELAATRFPELVGSRSELLLRLTEVAEASLLEQPADRDDARAEAKRRVLERTRRTTAEEAEQILAAREADWHRDFGS
jgi:hypothetical protein